MRRFRIILFLLFVLFLVGAVFFGLKNKTSPASLPPATSYSAAPKIETVAPETAAPEEVSLDPVLPAEVNLSIPFTSQAPHQNWDLPYQHFCEEASILMAASYIKGETISGAADADAKMLVIKNFEEKKFGYYEDTTAEETALILKKHFGLANVEVVFDPTAEKMKHALAEGRAVILPLAGREIGNPNYRQPGPLYHMLVVKGFTKNGSFITNDPGTRKGADYVYKSKVLLDAIHDWNGGNVNAGKKVMIIAG